MTITAARPVDLTDAVQLDMFADPWTAATGKPWFDRFRAACWQIAQQHDGLVDPNLVRRLLIDERGYAPQRYAAAWSRAGSPHGFLDWTDLRVPIDPAHSLRNGAKDVRVRRWRDGVPATA